MKKKSHDYFAGLEKFSDRELAEDFVFPSNPPETDEEKKAEEEFWTARRNDFKDRTERGELLTLPVNWSDKF